MNRTVLTIAAVAGAIALVVVYGLRGEPAKVTPTVKKPTAAAPKAPDDKQPPRPQPEPGVENDQQPPSIEDSAPPSPTDVPAPPAADDVTPMADLIVVEPDAKQPEPVLGSTDQGGEYEMEVRLSPWGAGVKHIKLAHHSTKALEHIPYPIQQYDERLGYPMAALSVTINGQSLTLSDRRWTVTEHDQNGAKLEIVIASSETNKPVLRIVRHYELTPGRYDLQLKQRLFNLTDQPLAIVFSQTAQGDVPLEGGYLGDKRSVIIGYHDLEYDPGRRIVNIGGHEYKHSNVLTKDRFAQLWPTQTSVEDQHEMVFASLNNRYFSTAVHLPVDTSQVEAGGPIVRSSLQNLFPVITRRISGVDPKTAALAFAITSTPQKIAPGKTGTMDLSLYAGPKDPEVLADDPGYVALGLDQLIIYNIGGCCSFLTFAWLAKGLLTFLDLLHSVLADWGLAIIVLVVCVRTLLHPITKRSQVNMMKFSKQMQVMQPELERLKKKWKDDQSKLNAEMMNLYREKGVNPAAMGLGCLPMFLQTPLWIALYAMLFFAIELRHEPAFYDVFHKAAEAMGKQWSFLTDLSSPDNFIKFDKPVKVLFFSLESLNIIPLFMAVVFVVQQKFMQPPPSPTVTDQQKQQQKMMKYVMMLFPIFLYKAPSGLTLYIFASTCSGIVDSYFVRKHLKEQEDAGTLFEKKSPKPRKEGGFWDKMQKAADAKRSEIEAQRKKLDQQQGRSKRKR